MDTAPPPSDTGISSTVRLPLWVRTLDAIATGALILGLVNLIVGPARWPVGSLRVTASSPLRALGVAVVLLVIRHARVRDPTLWTRTSRFVVEAWGLRSVRAGLSIGVASRLAVVLTGYFAVILIGYEGGSPPFRISKNEFENLGARWDAGWYLGIASQGYRWNERTRGQQNIAFFPAYPFLVRAIGGLFGAFTTVVRADRGTADPPEVVLTLAGMAISVGAFALALIYLHLLVLKWFDPSVASFSLLLLAAYPFALFFSAVYTESLFLLEAVAAFLAFERGRYLRAGIWGLLAGLTRPNGFLLSVPLALLALRPRQGGGLVERPGLLRRLASVAMPGVGMLVFSAYVWSVTGNPFEWVKAHEAWGRTYRGMGQVITEQTTALAEQGLYTYSTRQTVDVLNGSATILCLLVTIPVARRIGLAYGAFILVNLIPPLLRGGLLSMGRVTAVLFPVFVYLALRLRADGRSAVIVAFSVLQGLLAAVFFTWRSLY